MTFWWEFVSTRVKSHVIMCTYQIYRHESDINLSVRKWTVKCMTIKTVQHSQRFIIRHFTVFVKKRERAEKCNKDINMIMKTFVRSPIPTIKTSAGMTSPLLSTISFTLTKKGRWDRGSQTFTQLLSMFWILKSEFDKTDCFSTLPCHPHLWPPSH